MTRFWPLALSLAVSLTATTHQAEDRSATRQPSIVEAIRSAGGTAVDPVWVAWTVPMVPGERDLCGTWSDGVITARGLRFEDAPRGSSGAALVATGAPEPPQERPLNEDAPVSLDAGTRVVVWARVIDGLVERIRLVREDCPVDTGTARIVRLDRVSATESLAFFDAVLTPPALRSDAHQRLSVAALGAVALHADAAADAILARYLQPSADDRLRRTAATWLGRTRGASGFAVLLDRLQVHEAAVRRAAAAGLTQSRQPATVATLWRLAESDADDEIRAEVLGALAELTSAQEVGRITTRMAAESSDRVKAQAVRGLARRPAATSIPILLDLARTSPDRVVRLEAVRVLSRSDHPGAQAYLAEVLR